ncbi:oxysterol-binding protein-related protein 1C-like isoform X1 [Lycium ferocissimum]|uniref:oxysterol-binding protein-related protein 1C-like isoform X1 n=1 Tax=Lycium ferocissimum TaxID=112874 RepID=UPI002814ACF7|nr:oxysterol-binding protein-related protein 1C-like isoform X1 [Lycium ferocissimum]
MHSLCCDTDVADRNTNNVPLAKFLDMQPPPSRATRANVEAEYSGDELFHSARMNDLNNAGNNGISGILYKWVNYGRGWRPRWFVLHDGVLSYYKIHGRHKIVTNLETEKGSMIVGEKSFRRINTSPMTSSKSRRKPFGEIHLKVSSVRESRSDDRRFSINTGTKRLHLRAESREDRNTWLEALTAAKRLFPTSDPVLDVQMNENVSVSTEKLRQRLLEDGVSEAVIRDSEQIMRNEFVALHSHLQQVKRKQMLLLDKLGQLETEKVDLENTLIDEGHRQAKDRQTYSEASLDKFRVFLGGSASGSDNEEDESDDEVDADNLFFDANEFLSSSSTRSTDSDDERSSFDSAKEFHPSEDGLSSGTRFTTSDYPYVKRRKKLPEPLEKEKGVGLWSMIKDNIGKDLTKVCLPVFFNEPLSSLQRCFEDFEYSYLLDQAYEWGKTGNSIMRILSVAAFAASGYASTDGRIYKPFNPLLGETYEADYPDKGLRFISEKVSHHPMILACHCEGRGWKFWGDTNLKSKFWGRSIQLDPVGALTLEFDDGEVFQWSKVTTSIYNIIIGKLYCDHYGTMHIRGNREYSCKLKFKEQSIVERNPHQVHGVIHDKSGKRVATISGKWDESLHYSMGDSLSEYVEQDSDSKSHLLWKRSKPSNFQTKYNLTRFAITLNELSPELKQKLPPTDSRLRPDQRFLENGEYEMADSEKLRLEQRQREASKMQERGWQPRWFAKPKGSDTYQYKGGYWEARQTGKWESCPHIFGEISQQI